MIVAVTIAIAIAALAFAAGFDVGRGRSRAVEASLREQVVFLGGVLAEDRNSAMHRRAQAAESEVVRRTRWCWVLFAMWARASARAAEAKRDEHARDSRFVQDKFLELHVELARTETQRGRA